jgi:hypothetical protein
MKLLLGGAGAGIKREPVGRQLTVAFQVMVFVNEQRQASRRAKWHNFQVSLQRFGDAG